MSNRKCVSKCLNHPDSKLNSSGPCDGYFVYVYPKDYDKNNERWIGFLSKGEDGNPAKHSHLISIASKISTMVDCDIAIAIKNNPNLTAKDTR